MNRFFRLFAMDQGEPALLDHVAVEASDNREARYAAKLAEASRRYGRPFKCGPDELPHEVLGGGIVGEHQETA